MRNEERKPTSPPCSSHAGWRRKSQHHDKPVRVLLVQVELPLRPEIQRLEKNPGWLGICFNVENNDTIDLMEELKRDLKIEIIDL